MKLTKFLPLILTVAVIVIAVNVVNSNHREPQKSDLSGPSVQLPRLSS